MTPRSTRSSAFSSSQTISINDLPNELLVQIFDSVPSSYHEQCKAFSAIASVNRLFHSIITPLLYCHFQDCCAKHLQLFGRTVLSNKDRAELIKYYEGRRDGFIFNSPPSGCPRVWNDFALDHALEAAVVKRLPDLPSPITRTVFAFALACICPSLQRVDVTNAGNLLIKQLSGSVPHAITPLQQIRTLSIAIEPDRAYRLDALSLLFMLPSLQALTIDMAAFNDKEELSFQSIERFWQCHSRSSAIRDLTLERCGLPAIWIAEMIASCQALRRFQLEHYYWDNDANYYPCIFQALTLHEGTLFDVRMNELNGCKLVSARHIDPSQPISFQHFTSLTHLDIPLFSFCTRTHHCAIDQLLPHSLQILTVDLRSAREGFSDSFFISLAEASSSHLTKLKSMEVICRIEEYREDGYLPLHFCHLRRMFASYGIELVYFLEFVQCEFKAGICISWYYSQHNI